MERESPRYDLTAWLFLRGLGLIYLIAFVSFAVQADGLIGSHGILPLHDYLGAIREKIGTSEGFLHLPTLFWFDDSDFSILMLCWAGVVLALSLTCNFLPRVCLPLLFVFYLSLFYAGQTFMTFQWDLLLLEVGFLAVVLSFAATPGVWLLRWLLFRFMFLSGSVKLLSGDPSWASLTALSYHFETQPLPTVVAWYAHHLPAEGLMLGTTATFIVELLLPFLIFSPRPLRFVAAGGFLLLEGLIFLTGNYNFFNLLTMLLCLPLFDDAALAKIQPRRVAAWLTQHIKPETRNPIARYAALVVAIFTVPAGILILLMTYGVQPPALLQPILAIVEPLRIVNSYGLFAVMTTRRQEIVVEGSDDGVNWKEYEFKYKPGDVRRAPVWNTPHQPRLDWQMWFAALGTKEQNPWFERFLNKLWNNQPEVTGLLAFNPFPPPHNPHYVRAMLYDYRFSTPDEKRKTGAWWVRREGGAYYPITPPLNAP